MRRSRILEKLRRGAPAVIPHVWVLPHWKVVDMIGVAGFDGVWIEHEHSDFDHSDLSQMILAARAHDMDCVVRTPRTGYTSIAKVLEAGATGIIVPHCMNAEDARGIVRDAKFAPLGMRAMGGSVDTGYGTADRAEYMEHANGETMVAVMIEDKEAVEDVDAIAATEGVDVLFVGPGDLSQSYGAPGQLDHELVLRAVDATAEACESHGKSWGMPAFNEKELRRLLDRGARFMEYGLDQTIMMSGLLQAKETLRANKV